MDQSEKTVKELLKFADIKINGNRPQDIKILDNRFYKRVLDDGSLGLGESYMDGWWDTKRLDETIAHMLRAGLDKKAKKNMRILLAIVQRKLFNVGTTKRAYIVGQKHYDIGNELYERMLDRDMNYTCGYWKGLGDLEKAWKNPANLDKAQTAKLDLVCRKLHLKPGMKVLDTGCGFGNFARYAAKNYGVEVVGFTVSKEQAIKARERCKGLPVQIRLQDYREIKHEKFDAIASIGIMEHITVKNYETYLSIMEKCLKKEGLFLIHTVGLPESTIENEQWIEKYIFPNSQLPSINQISKFTEGKFIIEDVQNFGAYYYPTLMSWFANFDKSWKDLTQKYPEKYDERFYRMWKYYLLSFAGAFKCRSTQLFQIVLSKTDTLSVYESVR